MLQPAFIIIYLHIIIFTIGIDHKGQRLLHVYDTALAAGAPHDITVVWCEILSTAQMRPISVTHGVNPNYL